MNRTHLIHVQNNPLQCPHLKHNHFNRGHRGTHIILSLCVYTFSMFLFVCASLTIFHSSKHDERDARHLLLCVPKVPLALQVSLAHTSKALRTAHAPSNAPTHHTQDYRQLAISVLIGPQMGRRQHARIKPGHRVNVTASATARPPWYLSSSPEHFGMFGFCCAVR